MTGPAIRVAGLRKSYGDLEAVRGIDLEVGHGEVFAFLGPNGAGKTTTVEILEGYRKRDAGEVSVLGEDPASVGRDWRERVGIVLQECRLTRELTPREMLSEYAGYYRAPRDVEETLALVGLEDKADVRNTRLSGGQQRRLDVGLALIGDPELLFLDEPTTGFDPFARRQAWEMVSGLRELGKTVFLTTHYMEEAQALADRAAILAGGEIVAEGTPRELSERAGAGSEISFALASEGTGAPPPPFAVAGAGRYAARVEDPVPVLGELALWAGSTGAKVLDLEVTRPSLEDVYLELTGADADAGEDES